MKSYETSVLIAAVPEDVWTVLTDTDAYSSWDSGVLAVTGQVALGARVTVRSAANPKRAFPVTVTELQPPQRMVWSGGMPLGLFRGVRTFTLAAESGGGTRFHMREKYTGPMLPLIWRSMPDLQPSFDQFARGLKARVESAT